MENIMLVNLNAVLKDAQAKKYGVGLFNTVNLEMAQGVLQAAEALRAPVIIGTAEVLLPYASLEELAPMLISMASRASVPVVVHFDHGLTLEKVRLAMDLGFTSVMYDCSALAFEENCRAVAALTQEAHARNVTVEAELGHVGANEGDDDKSVYTQPNDAAEFCGRTGVDALAVAVGTAHGAYKSKPQLNFPLLEELSCSVPVPLVLHGGSGLSENDFQTCIQHGIAKVNIFTDINQAAAQAAHDCFAAGKGMTDVMPEITAAVRKATEEKMRIFSSAGQA